MKKLITALFAMILVNTTFSWGQNIDAYYSSYNLKKQKAELEREYGKFKRVDHYAGKTTVDDGFGGIWNVKDIQFRVGHAPEYILWRPSNRFIQRGSPGIDISGDVDKLPLDPKSLYVLGGLNVAFHGYFKGVATMRGVMSIILWIDPNTGAIDEVAFWLYADPNNGMNMGAAIPPRNYALFEDILKKTVVFDVKNIEFNERNIESNYCYYFRIPFRHLTGVSHSPDFLEGHYPPNYDGF